MAAASRARDRVHGAVALPPGRRRDAGSGEHADPVAKVTILSRGAPLGVTEQLPAFERHLYPESHLTASLAVRLGGRAAEIIILAEPSTGSASDLAGATELATHMVREWGLPVPVMRAVPRMTLPDSALAFAGC